LITQRDRVLILNRRAFDVEIERVHMVAVKTDWYSAWSAVALVAVSAGS
jgi:hypothetical protein